MRLQSLLPVACFILWFPAHGQDGTIERKFLREKERIKNAGIEQITEFESFQRSGDGCDSTKLRATHKYKFDRDGNLIEASDHQGSNVKTSTYTRNDKGEYTAKDYLYFDLRGNLQAHEVWKLEFNGKGQLVKEQLMREREVLRTNVMEYNELGQRTSQTTDSTFKWTMKYDHSGNLIEFREWRKQQTPDFVCFNITSYKYDNNQLINEVTQSATTPDVWNDCVYKYDNDKRLIETVEKRTILKRLSNGATEAETTDFRTMYVNHNKGNPSKASIYIDKETRPFKCRYFSYLVRSK